MSGGVDSSVAAALLQERGHDVFGVTMRLFCNTKATQTIADARAVCHTLGIPHHVIDAQKPFTARVVAPFLASYRRATTPNPCVDCNRDIKFGYLLRKAKALGANFLATGHYAKRVRRGQEYCLLRAKDRAKDQSYFLYSLTQKALAGTLFPLGNYSKPQVRAQAKSYGFLNHDQPESQEICFVPGKTRDYLKKELKTVAGKIVDEQGEEIGRHEGAVLYTVGQRAPVSPGGPYYVWKADPKKNLLFATKDRHSERLRCNEVTLRQATWISGQAPRQGEEILLQARYQGPLQKGVFLGQKGSQAAISLARAIPKPAEGQSGVLYRANTALGGGIIAKTRYV